MAAMGVDYPVVGDLPQPQMIGHDRMGQIVLQAAVGLDQHFLHDVAHVDPPLNPLVQPQLHHPPQRIAVPLHQPVDGGRIALPGMLEQFLGLFGVGPH